MTKAPLRLMLVDDQQLMRQGLRTLLELEDDLSVVAEAPDGAEALRTFEALRPDVVLMDIRMPVMDGVESTRRILASASDARIIVLTTFDEDELVYEAIRAGARGYLLKDVSGSELAHAVRTVAAGGAVLEPSVARKVMEAFSVMAPAGPSTRVNTLDAQLSGRERAVLRLLGEGLSNKEIATRLFLVEGTVKNHVSAVLQKLGVRDRVQAVLKAREAGLLEG